MSRVFGLILSTIWNLSKFLKDLTFKNVYTCTIAHSAFLFQIGVPIFSRLPVIFHACIVQINMLINGEGFVCIPFRYTKCLYDSLPGKTCTDIAFKVHLSPPVTQKDTFGLLFDQLIAPCTWRGKNVHTIAPNICGDISIRAKFQR